MGTERSGGDRQRSPRSDDVSTKIALLNAARERGDHRLALAVADSLKDGIEAEWRLASGRGEPEPPVCDLDARSWRPVQELLAPQARWAAGWSWYQAVTLVEPAGIARHDEPLDLLVAAPAAWCASLARELRVARLDPHTGALQQVASQVYGEQRVRAATGNRASLAAGAPEGGLRAAHLVWQASVLEYGSERFLVFCGNPAAELPRYVTDLQTRGTGYALEIENAHYTAALSGQNGQLERLRYKRAHGLELYAGGEGHGEPPHIDWAHDYLAAGKFQKFRVTNWERCRNFEVVHGPICTVVRRWGFPHSPLHPVFTTARMLVDVSYTFYAGVPYFVKQGRMEAVQDFTLNYLRDDEWVFSGYSFTDILWMDEAGRAHENAVPSQDAGRMWGVGFYHRDSRDSFFAIRLDHRLVRPQADEDNDANTHQTEVTLHHADAPSLDYRGHGQLWSRWALRGDPRLRTGDTLLQRNAYVVEPYGAEHGAAGLEQWRRRLLEPLVAHTGAADRSSPGTDLPSGVTQLGALAADGESPDEQPLKAALWEALRDVRDDMFYTVDANLADMGYVSDLRFRDGVVEIVMTMPHRGRPKFRYLGNPAAARLAQVTGVRTVIVTPVWEPAWTPDRMSDRAWATMGLDGGDAAMED